MIEKEIYYNTQREPLRLSEYGRHVQEMVNYIKTKPDREERNRLAHVVIQIMANFNPSYIKTILNIKQSYGTNLLKLLIMN